MALGRALARCGLEVGGGRREEESGAAEKAAKGGHAEVEVTLDGEYVR